MPSATLFLGALIYDGPPDTIAAWRAKLEHLTPPIIYVTFGTVCFNPAIYRMIMSVARHVAASFVVTSLQVGADEIGPMPPNVFFERYIPNTAILGMADIVIHHGGHGTWLAALSSGVPSLVIPQNVKTAGQTLHGKMAQDLHVGLCLDIQRDIQRDAQTHTDHLTAAIEHVLDPSFRTAARHLRQRLDISSQALQTAAMHRLQSDAAGQTGDVLLRKGKAHA